MGKRFTVFDDLDEKIDADRTFPFSVDGVSYEIDLAQKNIDKFMSQIEPFISAARRTGRAPAKAQARTAARKPSDGLERDAIRHWAGKNGFRVSDKGRIPEDVREAYNAAHLTVTKVEPAKAAAPPTTPTKAAPSFSAAK